MPYYVYILECKNTTLYTGITNNLERRLHEHQTGQGGHYTSYNPALKIRYFEEHSTRSFFNPPDRALACFSLLFFCSILINPVIILIRPTTQATKSEIINSADRSLFLGIMIECFIPHKSSHQLFFSNIFKSTFWTEFFHSINY